MRTQWCTCVLYLVPVLARLPYWTLTFQVVAGDYVNRMTFVRSVRLRAEVFEL